MIVRVADDLWINSDHVIWAQKKPPEQSKDENKVIVLTLDGQLWDLDWTEWEKIWK